MLATRGLLLTVLGELVLPHDRAAWTQTLLHALKLVGIKDSAARQALARLRDRGWLESTRAGRQTRWHLTDESERLLTAGAERIYGFGQTERLWDGSWVVLLASVPEVDRTARYRMAQGLSWAGFGSLGQGTWISPWAHQENAAVALLQTLGIRATSFRSELGKVGSASELVAEAWDLEALSLEYGNFVTTTEGVSGTTGGESVAALIDLVHRWRRFPFLDPDLPAELLGDDWPGHHAAHRFESVRGQLTPEARHWWVQAEERHSPKSG